jgi:hypothetical protein
MPLGSSADKKNVTPVFPENISACGLDEIFAIQAENRAWNKELRALASALVNTRLAKNISMEDYTATRQRAAHEAAECKRRAMLLLNEIDRRAARPLPQINLLKEA